MLSNGVSGWLLMKGGGARADLRRIQPDDGLKLWRRGWDLNPRYPLRYVRFRGGSFQPLTHLSGKTVASYQYPVASKSESQRLERRMATSPEPPRNDQRQTTNAYRIATGAF